MQFVFGFRFGYITGLNWYRYARWWPVLKEGN